MVQSFLAQQIKRNKGDTTEMSIILELDVCVCIWNKNEEGLPVLWLCYGFFRYVSSNYID